MTLKKTLTLLKAYALDEMSIIDYDAGAVIFSGDPEVWNTVTDVTLLELKREAERREVKKRLMQGGRKAFLFI